MNGSVVRADLKKAQEFQRELLEAGDKRMRGMADVALLVSRVDHQ